MRFPKEKVVITNKIKEMVKDKDFYGIYKEKDEILKNYLVLEPSIYADLISSTFFIGNFDEAIVIGNDLFSKKIESFEIIYYTLLSLIANVDIYQAMSIIKKSQLLNLEDIKVYHFDDGANYSNLLHFSSPLSSATLSLLIVNFVEGLSREISGNVDIDQEFILFRFFDLINMVYELGYPIEIIQELSRALKVIFNLDV